MHQYFDSFLNPESKDFVTDTIVEDTLRNWHSCRIRFPHWMVPYARRPLLCLKHNHIRGLGCERGPTCTLDHICMFCEGPHSPFGTGLCPVLSGIRDDDRRFVREHGIPFELLVRVKRRALQKPESYKVMGTEEKDPVESDTSDGFQTVRGSRRRRRHGRRGRVTSPEDPVTFNETSPSIENEVADDGVPPVIQRVLSTLSVDDD